MVVPAVRAEDAVAAAAVDAFARARELSRSHHGCNVPLLRSELCTCVALRGAVMSKVSWLGLARRASRGASRSLSRRWQLLKRLSGDDLLASLTLQFTPSPPEPPRGSRRGAPELARATAFALADWLARPSATLSCDGCEGAPAAPHKTMMPAMLLHAGFISVSVRTRGYMRWPVGIPDGPALMFDLIFTVASAGRVGRPGFDVRLDLHGAPCGYV